MIPWSMLRNNLAAAVLAAAAGLGASAAHALDVGGVRVPDTAKIGNAELALNGAGIRTRAIFKVYVGALYLPQAPDTPPQSDQKK